MEQQSKKKLVKNKTTSLDQPHLLEVEPTKDTGLLAMKAITPLKDARKAKKQLSTQQIVAYNMI